MSHTARFVGVRMKTGFPLGIRGRVGRLRAARVAQGHILCTEEAKASAARRAT